MNLKEQKNELLIQIDAKKKGIAEQQRQLAEYLRNLKVLEEQIRQENGSPSINVTDHAIVQYLIRGKGFTRKELEQELIDNDVYDALLKAGGTAKIHYKNMTLVFKDYDLITVYKKNERK